MKEETKEELMDEIAYLVACAAIVGAVIVITGLVRLFFYLFIW